jgi:hypothetical protein
VFKVDSNIVISLGDDGAIVSYFKNSRLMKRIFVTSPLSSDFTDLLKASAEAPVYLLLDTIDQNYIFSNIPNVGKSNVSKIMKRKMATEFDQNDINSYLFLGKEIGVSKTNLKYLFVSIRNSSPFKDWAEVIYQLPNKFMGIYLLPVESEEFIKKIRKATHGEGKTVPDEWEVFISYNRVGGFRQVVLKNSKLIFTRISQSVSLQTPDSIGKNISQEAANTLEYIRRIGFYDQSIFIYVICSKEASNFVDIPGVKAKDVYVYSPFELGQKLNMSHAAQENDKFGDVIFAANFVENKKKILKLVTPDIKLADKLNLTLKMINLVSYFLIAVLPAVSIYMLINAFSNSGEIESAENQIRMKQTELTSIKDFEAEHGVKAEVLTEIVKAKQDFSTKDKIFFDLMEKYKQADTFSTYLSEINFSKVQPGPGQNPLADLALKVAFDFSSIKNYSDILYQLEQYKAAITAAFAEYDLTYAGFPSENDIKVDLEGEDGSGGETKANLIEITVNIKTKQ